MGEHRVEDQRKCTITSEQWPVPTMTGHVAVRSYDFQGFRTTIAVPEDFAKVLEQKSESPGESLVTPADLIEPIKRLPCPGVVHVSFLLNEPLETTTNAPAECIRLGIKYESFIHALTFYRQKNDDTLFANAVAGWSVLVALDHTGKFDEGQRAYQLARLIESGTDTYPRTPEYARTFAADLTRLILAKDYAEINALAKPQPLTAAAIGFVLDLCLRREEKNRANYEMQMHAVQNEIIPAARKLLVQKLNQLSSKEIANSDEIRLLAYIGDASDFQQLKNLNSLQLDGEYYRVTDFLSGATNLEELDLTRNSALRLSGNDAILGLRQLKKLTLGQLSYIDDFICEIEKLTKLEELALRFTKFRDTAVPLIYGIPLKKLDITGCSLSEESINCLKSSFPRCQIIVE